MWNILKQDFVLLFSTFVALLLILCKFYYLDKIYIIEDEAYYWYWANFPSWGYPEHPPMIAWLIYPFKQIWGAHPYSIRLISMTLFLSLSPIVYFWTYRFCDFLPPVARKKHAWIVALVVQIIPFYNGASLINLPDTPLIFFLFLTSFLYYLAFFHQKKYFVLAGISLGLAGLSKLTAAHFGMAIVLFVILSPKRREYIASPWLWLSFLIAGLVFLPYIVWNEQHGFPVLNNVGRHLGRTTNLTKFHSFWIEQSILYLPLSLFFFISLIVPSFRKYLFATSKTIVYGLQEKKSQQVLYIVLLSLTPFLYFLYKSFTLPLRINWLSGVFIGGVIVVGMLIAHFWERMKYLFLAYTVFIFFVFGILLSFLSNATNETNWTGQFLKKVYPEYNYYLKSYYEYDFFSKRFDDIYQKYIVPINNERNNQFDSPRPPLLPIVAKGYQTPSLVNYYQQPTPAAFGWARQESYVQIVYFYLDQEREYFDNILRNDYFLLSRSANPDLTEFDFNFNLQKTNLIHQFSTYPEKPEVSKDYYLFLVESK